MATNLHRGRFASSIPPALVLGRQVFQQLASGTNRQASPLLLPFELSFRE